MQHRHWTLSLTYSLRSVCNASNVSSSPSCLQERSRYSLTLCALRSVWFLRNSVGAPLSIFLFFLISFFFFVETVFPATKQSFRVSSIVEPKCAKLYFFLKMLSFLWWFCLCTLVKKILLLMLLAVSHFSHLLCEILNLICIFLSTFFKWVFVVWLVIWVLLLLLFVCVVCVCIWMFVIAVEIGLDSTYFRVLLLFG